jgi:hypothetical protein
MTKRFGVVTPRGFLSNVVVLWLGKTSGLQAMQLLHHALKDHAPTALNVDDSDPKAPAFFFDFALAVPRADDAADDSADVHARVSVFGVKGMGNAHLPSLLPMGHAFVVWGDGSLDLKAAAATLASRVGDRKDEVYAVTAVDSVGVHDAVVSVVAALVHGAAGVKA